MENMGDKGENGLPLEIDREPESFLSLLSQMWNKRTPSLGRKDRKKLNTGKEFVGDGSRGVPEEQVRLKTSALQPPSFQTRDGGLWRDCCTLRCAPWGMTCAFRSHHRGSGFGTRATGGCPSHVLGSSGLGW